MTTAIRRYLAHVSEAWARHDAERPALPPGVAERRAELARRAELIRTPGGRARLAFDDGQATLTETASVTVADHIITEITAVILPPDRRFRNGSRWALTHVTPTPGQTKTRQTHFRSVGMSWGRIQPTGDVVNTYTFQREALPGPTTEQDTDR